MIAFVLPSGSVTLHAFFALHDLSICLFVSSKEAIYIIGTVLVKDKK